ncbi:MAG: hypothetical protein NVSMB12_19010 [Acidimicrobiales bacterium]
MSRRGASAVTEVKSASAEWRNAVDRARLDVEERHIVDRRNEGWVPEVWQQDDDDQPAPAPSARPAGRKRAARPLPEEVTGELVLASSARRAPRLARDLAIAAQAYEAGRWGEAQRLLKALAEAAPTAAGVRELHGLALYRLGRWRAAKAELEASIALTTSVDQLPVIADCERAMGHHDAVEQLIEDLRKASPGVEVLAEGRLVLAGSRADRGRLTEAIDVLSRWEPAKARPKEWHLRTWYALADLYERAGEVPRARELFRRLVEHDPEFFDAAERLSALR